MSHILTVYYSRKGENYVGGAIKSLAKGNTQIVAEFIHRAVGGDLFEIDTVKPYAADYHDCTQEAAQELRANARPELKALPESIAAYDTLFVGYPNWWGTCPMAVFTFLTHFDLTGKRILPFCTNEGSGMGKSEQDLRRICEGAEVLPGLAVFGHEAARAESTAVAWAKQSLKE